MLDTAELFTWISALVYFPVLSIWHMQSLGSKIPANLNLSKNIDNYGSHPNFC